MYTNAKELPSVLGMKELKYRCELFSRIPIRVYIEYRYTDADRGDVYWIYVLS